MMHIEHVIEGSWKKDYPVVWYDEVVVTPEGRALGKKVQRGLMRIHTGRIVNGELKAYRRVLIRL